MIDEKTKVSALNKLIETRRVKWTPLMTRCFVQILGEFTVRYEDWAKMKPKNLFGDLDYSYLCHYSFCADEIDGNHIEDISRAMLRLSKEGMYDKNEKGDWEYVNVIGKSKYIAANKQFSVNLNYDFVPYLVFAKEKGCYTTFNAYIARQFSGKYTERFYEFIQEYRLDRRKRFFLTMTDMRERFGLTERDGQIKYKSQKDFIRYVVEPSQTEMKKLYDGGTCDVYFDWNIPKEEKTILNGNRRESDRIWFTIHEKEILLYVPGSPHSIEEMKQQKLQAAAIFPQLIERLRNIYQTVDPNSRYIDSIRRPLVDAIAKDRNTLFQLMERLEELDNNADIQNLPGYIRHILEHDYNIFPIPDKVEEAKNDRNVAGIAAGLANKFNINKK